MSQPLFIVWMPGQSIRLIEKPRFVNDDECKVGEISVLRSSCMDRKKTGDQTGPDHSRTGPLVLVASIFVRLGLQSIVSKVTCFNCTITG
jgi:hypothetical protein